MTHPQHLPAYTDKNIKQALINIGASGTIYSLVMPETESALQHVVDGGDHKTILSNALHEWKKIHDGSDPSTGSMDNIDDMASFLQSQFDNARVDNFLSMYHEPWTSKQDAMHQKYFDTWFDWVSPIVSINKDDFAFQYPTPGASEGIFKVMAEYEARCATQNTNRVIHIFEGEYEGFPAFAESLGLEVKRHKREDWKNALNNVGPHEQFWISQPSAIDGMVWDDFEDFTNTLNNQQPTAELIPDLSYVGIVAREFSVNVNSPNIPCVIFSHSKPCGGYYHRIGGIVCKDERLSLVGNKWFKNLLSLKLGTEMMERHGVFDLPRKYRPAQEQACAKINQLLGNPGLKPADVMLLGIAPASKNQENDSSLLQTLTRGSGDEKITRVCLTPMMTTIIDPNMAPTTAPTLMKYL